MNVEQQFQRAVEHYHSGNLKKAESKLAKLLRKHPGQPDALHLLSVISLQNERPEAAARYLREFIATNSEMAEAHDLLGIALRRTDRLEEAVKSFKTAISINPRISEFHYNLANALRQDKQMDQAVHHYEQAISLEPLLTNARYNLGQCYADMGRPRDAAEAFRQVVRHSRDDIDAYVCLAKAFADQGDHDRALAILRDATGVTSDGASAQVKIGDAMYQLGRLTEAVQCFDRALALAPELLAALNGKGLALRDLGDVAGAAACFREALAAAPENLTLLYHLTELLERTNKTDEAKAVAEQGLAISPDDPQINLIKARLERRDGDLAEAANRLTRILENLDDQSTLRDAFHFELGRLYDREEDADRAYEHYCEANRLFSLQWPTQSKDKAEALESIDRHQQIFTADWYGSWSTAPELPADQTPVFLMGFPRTGSTLLDQILGGHSSIQVLEEESAIYRVRKRLEEKDRNYPDCLAQLSTQEIDELRAGYFNGVDTVIERRPGAVLIDKLPLHTIDAGLIHRLFPQSRIIFAIRHPCDICLSCVMQSFKANTGMSHFSTLKDAAAYYEKVLTLWASYQEVLPLDVHEVRYEDLVNDMESEARRLLEFLGLGWEDAVLEYTRRAESQEFINTTSYDQVTEKIYTRARYRWHRYREHLNPVLPRLKPFIEKFGYEA